MRKRTLLVIFLIIIGALAWSGVTSPKIAPIQKGDDNMLAPVRES